MNLYSKNKQISKLITKNEATKEVIGWTEKERSFINKELDRIFKKYELNLEDKKVKDYVEFLYKFNIKVKDNKKIKNFSKEFDRYQEKIISEAYFFEEKVKSVILREEIRKLFRITVGEYIFKSPIIKRAYEKPRGYPGDYFIFEMIYNGSLTNNGIGYYLDKWVLNYELTRGAIYRKDKIKKLLMELIKNNNKLDILNIGCGSSREIREIIAENKVNINNVTFTCLDQDEEALNFSKKSIRRINSNINISFLKQDILTILLNREIKQLDKYDVVYSIGVADYFLKTTFENFIKFCYRLLKPKGKLIIPLCSSHNPKLYIPLRWFCEWDFYSHDANDIKNFIQNEINIKKVKIIWEKRKPIFFIIIENNNER
jgi:SAM-dependent methyltransferase